MAKSSGGAGRVGRGGAVAGESRIAQLRAELASVKQRTATLKGVNRQLDQAIVTNARGGTTSRRASIRRPTAAKKQAVLKKFEQKLSQALARDNFARADRISRAFRRASGVTTKG